MMKNIRTVLAYWLCRIRCISLYEYLLTTCETDAQRNNVFECVFLKLLKKSRFSLITLVVTNTGRFVFELSTQLLDTIFSTEITRSERQFFLGLLTENLMCRPDIGQKLYQVYKSDPEEYDKLVSEMEKICFADALVAEFLALSDFTRLTILDQKGVKFHIEDIGTFPIKLRKFLWNLGQFDRRRQQRIVRTQEHFSLS